MSKPIRLYIIPSCGLKITFEKEVPNTIGRDPINYRISLEDLPIEVPEDKRRDLLHTKDRDDLVSGCMGPISNVSLPPKMMEKSGIHKDARYYAYMYPIAQVAQKLNWKSKTLDQNCNDLEKGEPCTGKENAWAKAYCFMLGAYVYFDQEKKVIQVNALSLKETNYHLQLAGPFKPPKEAVDGLRELDRVHPMTLEIFQECSYVAFGVSSPGELFRSKEVCAGNIHGRHGAFMFYRDDGTGALCYEIESGENFVDPSGKISSIHDAFEIVAKRYVYNKEGNDAQDAHERTFEFVTDNCLPAMGSDDRFKKKIVRAIADNKENVDNFRKEIEKIADAENTFLETIIHHACRAKCDKATIKHLLLVVDSTVLAKADSSVRWLPLHYACRHCAKDEELIKYLISLYKDAVTKKDIFHRCPLHIAVNSKPSVRVIEILLEHDTRRDAISIKTKNLKRSPIHIACNRGVEKEIIEKLLGNAEKKGTRRKMLNEKDALGSTALQLAIERGLNFEIIELLITSPADADADANDSDGDSSLYSPFNGMVPLAHACWNKASPETIDVLLNKDVANKTIDMQVEGIFLKTSKTIMDEIEGMLPIHLALKNANPKVVGLLLQKEKVKQRDSPYDSTVFKRDKKSRVPLHIACLNSRDANVIEQLLVIDARRETAHALDKEKRTPLHHACARENSNHEIIKLLLNAEKEFIEILRSEERNEKENNEKKYEFLCCENYIKWRARSDTSIVLAGRTTFSDHINHGFSTPQSSRNGDDTDKLYEEYKGLFILHNCYCAHQRDNKSLSPLFHAVKTASDHKAIALLLEPKQIYLKGFGSLVDDLAEITEATKEKELKEYLIEELSRRSYFCVMFMDIYSHAFALGTFLYCIEKLKQSKIETTEIYVLLAFFSIGALREVSKILSEGYIYMADLESWSEISSLTLIAFSSMYFMDNVDNTDVQMDRYDKNKLSACGMLLVINLIIILRTTFVPFARFVGGIILIFYTLIPFFAVSFLLLLAFAYSFRMSGDRAKCDTLTHCYLDVMQSFFAGAEGTKDLLDVLFGIVVIVVLLNVLIAIVEQAWQNAEKQTLRLFWAYRLKFLANNHFFDIFLAIPFLGKAEELLDDIEDIRFSDQIPWTKEPYNLIDREEKYRDPDGYFLPDIAKEIKVARSFLGDWYWVQKEFKKAQEDEKERLQTGDGKETVLSLRQYVSLWGKNGLYWKASKVILVFVFNSIIYFLVVGGGLATCGLLWPKSLRRKILSVGLNGEKKDSTSST